MSESNLRILLAQRPTGAPDASCFREERGPIPEPGEGQVRVRHRFVSLDPVGVVDAA